MRIQRTLLAAPLVVLLVVSATACQNIENENEPPTAVVEVLVGGDVVDTDAPIPFEGAAIELVLSGKKSADGDGTIEKYQWIRTDVPADQRQGDAVAPDGSVPFEGDPAARREATVTLGLGSYRYTLYVTDDDGAVGAPVSVSFSIETVSMYAADMACLDRYEGTNPECEACVCAPAEMDGCLDLEQICLNNADATFSELCKAVLDCGVAKACLGAACYTAELCAAEINAAAMYMGGAIGMCQDATVPPEANPCRAITLFSLCINDAMVVAPPRAGCGQLCTM